MEIPEHAYVEQENALISKVPGYWDDYDRLQIEHFEWIIKWRKVPEHVLKKDSRERWNKVLSKLRDKYRPQAKFIQALIEEMDSVSNGDTPLH